MTQEFSKANDLNFDDYFIPASLLGYAKRRHPYDFVETYQALKHIYGYQLNYVNLGFWQDDSRTVEPGRLLAYHLGEALDLQEGDSLVDAGSGLGQASVDLANKYKLRQVLGINPNQRQLAFANQLAKIMG